MGEFEGLFDESIVPAHSEAIEPAPQKERPLDACRRVRHQVYQDSLEVLRGALRFADLSESDLESPPQEWIDELGEEGAARQLRLAKMALLPEKESPVGLKLALQACLGITKALATEQTGGQSLNLAVVHVRDPVSSLPEIEVEGEER